MSNKQVIYASFQASAEMFANLFSNATEKPGQQVQKYNRLLAEGFALIGDVNVVAVTELPLTEKNYGKHFFKRCVETVNGIQYIYIPLINVHRLKDIFAVISSFFECLRWALKEKETIVIADILNAPVALGSYFASAITKKKYTAIVTDLPEYQYKKKEKAYLTVGNYLIKKADSFVFLAEGMNNKINESNKPYFVVEGMVDHHEATRLNVDHNDNKTRKIVFTGSVMKRHGIGVFTEGFLKARIDNCELHIYGSGDLEKTLTELSSSDSNVVFHGSVLIDEAVKAQREATLVVNPRPTTEEFTKYSFPSKNMEYMVSGTPLLTTNLPGMPDEYRKYVYLMEKEDPDGIAERLKLIFELPEDELVKKGREAREFVLREKNNKVIAEKVIAKLGFFET